MSDIIRKGLSLLSMNFWGAQACVFLILTTMTIFCSLRPSWSLRIDKSLRRLKEATDRQEILAVVSIILISILLASVFVTAAGVPIPQTHDEFAYLFASDTFLEGRLANPTPISPAHFESFHILVKPVFAAKYPPMQGLFLALGTFLTGNPIAGVWIAASLAGLSVFWMLRVFFASSWALFGAVIWMVSPINLLWCQSYWGGHAGVLGGALSLGAFFRLRERPGAVPVAIWGIGMLVLLNSRVYEGVVLSGILGFWWLAESLMKKPKGRHLVVAGASLAVVAAINISIVGSYNYLLTGNPWTLPYSLHHSQYHRTPLFIFQASDREPTQDVPDIIRRLDDGWRADLLSRFDSLPRAIGWIALRLPQYLFWVTRSPFLLVALILGLIALFRDKSLKYGRETIILMAGYFVFLVPTTFTGDRFMSPICGLVAAAFVAGIRTAITRSFIWRTLALSLPMVTVCAFLYGAAITNRSRTTIEFDASSVGSRRELEEFLSLQPGKDLVFLDTKNSLPVDSRFYVYNRASPEQSEIVWAHDLGVESNAALIAHLGDRNVWLLSNIDQRAVLTIYRMKADP